MSDIRTSVAATFLCHSIQGTLASPNQVAGRGFLQATPDAWVNNTELFSGRNIHFCHNGCLQMRPVRALRDQF